MRAIQRRGQEPIPRSELERPLEHPPGQISGGTGRRIWWSRYKDDRNLCDRLLVSSTYSTRRAAPWRAPLAAGSPQLPWRAAWPPWRWRARPVPGTRPLRSQHWEGEEHAAQAIYRQLILSYNSTRKKEKNEAKNSYPSVRNHDARSKPALVWEVAEASALGEGILRGKGGLEEAQRNPLSAFSTFG